ncbi:hypothetical protein P152DRAFT_455118 [Eremomyces bilateralis CBS 781.70]|uniref:Alpha,alpha-trehalose phosphate synthase-like protein subunit n=1 Tax=Eremomyces bilateralis CBS 781.70 TaxID=1392243 RepID=A0A6G1GBQ7_9PEZI|nr:uncharacterized protein P152DRAFT_455118 [Eremomyces bilateralis CBS 781.70]KAF1815412.1 hypothetical protein P152DRAFT_455118 [Eremomyces bilateralis CBS 781.70]
MPTFVCALFLPNTVDFHNLPSSDPSSPVTLGTRTGSVSDVPQVKTSLFPEADPPKTPSSNDVDYFFSKRQPSARSYFPKSNNPGGLVRSDSHVPEWGSALPFRQPKSRAAELPPDTILRYTQQQQAIDRAKTARSRRASQALVPSRSGSSDPNWGQEWTVAPAVQNNGDLANAVRATIDTGALDNVIWLGTVGFPTDSLRQQTKDEINERMESEFDSLTVFVKDSDIDGHYNHYCKTILWPVLHYQIPDHPKSKAYEDHSWKYYVNINQAFADKIIACYKRGDTIWIHDYHLLLVPGMVRNKIPDAQIGFFLHTAFPSSEVFRCLSVRNQLLNGMLGANLISFQSSEYADHFLTTCSRLLLVEATTEGVQLEHRFVNVSSIAIGIDPKGIEQERVQEEVGDWIKMMQERYKDKHLIVARDKLDNVRGVRQKLLAYELFLNKYPEWREKVVLIQVAVSASDNPAFNATVSDIVTRIESQHANLARQPLIFLRQDISYPQYLGLLCIADVLMITSLREGMNLAAHEFIYCQDGRDGGKQHGPVILSEFTGCHSLFDGSVLSVNPWNYRQCADAIKEALEMDAAEKERRYTKMREIVLKCTGSSWCTELSTQLSKCYNNQYTQDAMSIPRLSATQLGDRYRRTKRRLFILDYEGTLANITSMNSNVHLSSPQRVIDTLNDLLLDTRNIVYIMSGQRPENLERLFSRVPGLGIIAENGCFSREAGQDAWTRFADFEKMEEWKAEVKNVLQYYLDRIPGGTIEENHCSLRLKYGRAEDIQAAAAFAGDCANNVNDACSGMRIRAIHIHQGVLIEPYDWSKGSAATHIFDELRAGNGPHFNPVRGEGPDDTDANNNKGKEALMPDFLMVAGNDREDEGIFRWANNLQKDGVVPYVTTVSVGKRNTDAMSTLTQGTTGLLSVLTNLSKLNGA